jgi:hypothetical protein
MPELRVPGLQIAMASAGGNIADSGSLRADAQPFEILR